MAFKAIAVIKIGQAYISFRICGCRHVFKLAYALDAELQAEIWLQRRLILKHILIIAMTIADVAAKMKTV